MKISKKKREELKKVQSLVKEIIEKVNEAWEKSDLDRHAKIAALYMAAVSITAVYLDASKKLACFFINEATRDLAHMMDEEVDI